ncbi:hypothetical protein BOX15_Mlig002318g1 [Macrostomum lignano]|uniref:Uncharacterized protein n=2 Tax=Macrostomum lignano TaxID=282301 RepID=A0A267FFK9_9PLAT|nr:hypothetical protein BOX15_Mlig002318g1 [Macrostomum lignano]
MEHTQEAAGTAPMTLANQVNAVKEQIEKLLSSVMDYRSQEGVWPGDLQPERFDACCRLLELLASPSCIEEGRFVWKINYPHLRLRLQSGASARQSSLASPDFRWPDTGTRLRLQLRATPATEAGGEDEAALEVELLLLQSTVQRPLRARLQARLIDLRDPSCGGLTGQSETFSNDQSSSERTCCVLRDWPAKLRHLRDQLDDEGDWQFVKNSCAYLEATIVTEVQQ